MFKEFILENESKLQVSQEYNYFVLQPVGKKGKKYLSQKVDKRELSRLNAFLEEAAIYARTDRHRYENGIRQNQIYNSPFKISIFLASLMKPPKKIYLSFHGPNGGRAFDNSLEFRYPEEVEALTDFFWELIQYS